MAPILFLVNVGGALIAVLLRIVTLNRNIAHRWVRAVLSLFHRLIGMRVRLRNRLDIHIPPGSVLVSNFVGRESLPAYLVSFRSRICLPIRWFNFLVPVMGWAMWAASQVPVPTSKPKLFLKRIKRCLDHQGVYVHFVSDYEEVLRIRSGGRTSPMLNSVLTEDVEIFYIHAKRRSLRGQRAELIEFDLLPGRTMGQEIKVMANRLRGSVA